MTRDIHTSISPLEISRELTSSFDDLTGALRLDRAELQREVLLWQRWIRYAAVAVLVAAIMLFSGAAWSRAWQPIAAASALYVLLNALAAWHLARTPGQDVREGIPQAILLADITYITALIYFSSPPAQFHRILLLGFLVLQLTVFYFGTKLGFWAAVTTIGAYLLTSLIAPPFVAGPRPTAAVVAFNSWLYGFVAAVLVATFGSFRERMNRFRSVCKRAELGDLGGRYLTDGDRFPDDLTLLGRSFNEMRGRLLEMIGTDPLTQCLNRRALETRLEREWRTARRRDSTLALLAVDVDHFKLINDTRGHPVGDTVLQALGAIMRTTARDTDTVARLGGDEFVVLLPDTGWQGAMTFAERLRRNVIDHTFGGDADPLKVTISIGVALARGSDPISADDLLQAADRSLYKAKSSGRDRICA